MDENLEPLSETPLLGHGSCKDFARPASHRVRVVIVDQVYPSISCQQNIGELIKILFKADHYQSILVEGHQGPFDQDAALRGQSLEAKMNDPRSYGVSPGVQQAVEDLGSSTPVMGVDDPELVKQQHAAQNLCLRGEDLWEEVAKEARDWLRMIRNAVGYTDDMVFISQCLMPSTYVGADISLGDQARRLLKIGAREGLNLAAFPSLRKFTESLDREAALNFSEVERDRTQYVRALLQSTDTGIRRSSGQLEIALAEVAPMIEVWLNGTNRTVDQLRREVEDRGLSAVVSEGQRWVHEHLVESSRSFQRHALSSWRYYREMLAIGARLRLDVLAFPLLREYVRYVESAAEIPRVRLFDEFNTCARLLMKRLAQRLEHQQFFEVEGLVQILIKGGKLKLTPAEARNFRSDLNWRTLSERMGRLQKRKVSLLLIDEVEQIARAAFEFYRLSIQRGRLMVSGLIGHLSSGPVTGAILVCGGFHSSTVASTLNGRHREVAWAWITPKMNMDDVPGWNRS